MRAARQVDDWSWRATVRRVRTLARLTAQVQGAHGARDLLPAASRRASRCCRRTSQSWRSTTASRSRTCTRSTSSPALFVLAGLATIAASAAQTYFTGWTGERILADLRNTLFRHLQRLSLGFYERNRAGVIISRLTNDVEALDQLVTDGFTSLVQNSLTLIGTAIILFFLDWRLALAVLTILPLLVIATALFRKHSARAYRQVRERLGLVTATLAEDIAGMRVVQAFTRETRAERRSARSTSAIAPRTSGRSCSTACTSRSSTSSRRSRPRSCSATAAISSSTGT